jgi:flagellar biosynthesis protein FlhF
MNVRKFFANDARIALKKVKETLGADAVILSNRTVDGQVEIMAVAARDMAMVVNTPGSDAPQRPAPAPERVQAAYADDDYRVTLGQSPAAPAKNMGQRHLGPEIPAPRAAAPQREESWRPAAPAAAPARPAAPAAAPARRPLAAPVAAATVAPAEMMDELKALRRIVEQHLAGFAWGQYSHQQPAMTELLKRMLDAGFSPKLANEWLNTVDASIGPDAAMGQMRNTVEQKLKLLGAPRDLVEEGGVFALVGPTGVGKTTTAAKLAARCVLRHGRDKVALITSDGYRIGAHEQLRAYGRIMGVPVYAVKDRLELQNTLRDLGQKHLVLIDTMGMSQRDRHVGEQIGMFEDCQVERLLLLNASCRGDTMDDVVTAYAGNGLAGCVLTKIDEAVSLAPAIDVLIRQGLPLAYVTNGQRVPEDLHLPNPSYLVHRAFKSAETPSPHRFGDTEPALMMASAGYFPGQARHA